VTALGPVPSPTVRAVRRWFALFAAGEHDALFAEVPDDVVWEPYGAGRPFHGTAAVREHFAQQTTPRSDAHAYSFEQIGRCVLVSGSLRMAEGSDLVEVQLVWLYVFDDDERLRRATHFESIAEARAAADALAQAPLSEPAAGDPPAPDPPASSP
jgi:ketosteroid isomerase-like protein